MEKLWQAINITRKALDDKAPCVAAFGGGKDSVILLHVILRLSGHKVPVIFLDPPAQYPQLYYFANKLRAIWDLDITGVKTAGMEYRQGDIHPGLTAIADAASERGFRKVLTGIRLDEDSTLGALGSEMDAGKVRLINPILDFSSEYAWDYVRENGLPLCSLYGTGTKKLGCLPGGEPGRKYAVPAAKDGNKEEDALLTEKLKALGYV